MTRDAPLISVIVPTMNSAAVLPAALESLAAQHWRGFEVLLCDGASSDATLTIAASFVNRLPSLTIDSRRDAGVYDAINRGVRRSNGAWFLVLGSDDRIHDEQTLGRVADTLRSEQRAPLVHGDVRMMAPNHNGVGVGARHAGAVSARELLRNNVCQQCIFYRRDLFDELGGFELRYRLYADWDFNVRAALAHPIRWIDVIVADYAATGMSADAVDALYIAEQPERVLEDLRRRIARRDTWPLHFQLLRWANRFRRRGQWRRCAALVASWAALRGRRYLAPRSRG